MPLPKINAPIFELNLPSTGQVVKYRPFLVKEQKILMIAMESEDERSITIAIKQIINNCAIDSIDVEKLPVFDIEYFFTRLRAKSVGETVDLRLRHTNGINKKGVTCRHETQKKFDLMQLEVLRNPEHTDKIMIDEETGIGVKMKYPMMDPEPVSTEGKTQLDLATIAIRNSIDFIFDNENIYKKEDTSDEELLNFIDSLSQTQFEKVAKFFETMPKLKHKISWKCGGCGEEDNVELEGMSNFFVF